MSNAWKFFIVVESLLLVAVCWQIVHNVPSFIFFVLAIVILFYVLKKRHRTNFNQFQLAISIVILITCLLMSTAAWGMLIFAILFIGVKGIEISGLEFFQETPWRKKQMVMPNVSAAEPKNGRRFKRRWFGNDRIGSQLYEWDDINFILISGDTIIDLGNTLLPKEDNVVMIRKAFGRTRVLVPVGIGIVLEHSSLVGDVTFEDSRYKLRNESVKLYSDDYDENPRRLKIVTSTLLGDVEVIRV